MSDRKLPDGFDWKAFTPDDSPMGLPDVMADPVHQDLSTAKLAEGDVATDFELPLCDFSDGTESATGETFRLSEVAATCALRLQIRMPVVVDRVDDDVARAYGALPDRLYLVGRGGRIAFQGEPGPFGFQPDALEAAIERELEATG